MQQQSPFAQTAITQQRRHFREGAYEANALAEIRATTTTIQECPYEGKDALDSINGALRSMLAGMAGISATRPNLDTHARCFDTQTTQEIRLLVQARIDKA